MIKLNQFKAAFGIPSASPFCVKAEILLKMSGVPFEVVLQNDPRKAPKGKLPYIEDGNKKIGDSSLIRNHLENVYSIAFDKELDAGQRAVSLAFTKMIEEHLYWVVLLSRWRSNKNWPAIKECFFGSLPFGLRELISAQARKQALKSSYGHGLGRHTMDEVYEMGARDIGAIAVYLGDKPYFMGEKPTSVDATLYPMLAAILFNNLHSPLREAAESHKTLSPYCERMREKFFPDFNPLKT